MTEYFLFVIASALVGLAFAFCFWMSKFYAFIVDNRWILESYNNHIYNIKEALEKR